MKAEEKERLWKHALHEDNIFNNRLNFLLGFQSILLAVTGVLVSGSEDRSKLTIIFIVLIGLLFSFIGWLIQIKEKAMWNTLKERCIEFLPEFSATRERYQKRALKFFSTTWTMTHVIPLILILLWVLLLSYSLSI